MHRGRTVRWVGSTLSAAFAAITIAWAPPTDTMTRAGDAHPDDAMACDLQIIVSNTGSKTVQIYLYTSEMRVNSWTVPAMFRKFKPMQIQNARLEPGKTYRGSFAGAQGGCNVRRSWKVRYRVTGQGEYWAYLPDTKSRYVKWPDVKTWSRYNL